jgi:hypothetical protein
MAEQDPGLDYPALVRELAGARQALDEQQRSAHRWYAEQLAAARSAVEQAQEGVDDAVSRVGNAGAVIDRVDLESAQLWRALGARLGRRDARRLGTPPEPAVAAGAPLADSDPLVLMRHVRAKLDAVPARAVRPLWLNLALVLLLLVAVSVAIFLVAVRLS